jgi:hypothetical protein
LFIRRLGARVIGRGSMRHKARARSKPLRAGQRLFVVLGVVLGGLVPVMGRMQSVRVRDVGVMPGLLMIAGFIVLGRFPMMVGGALMVFRGGLVVLAALVRLRAHVAVLLFGCTDGGETATEV